MKIAPGVVWKRVGDELVLLDYDRGVYFGLDIVGAHVWRLIEEQRPVASIVDELLDEFDVERDTLAVDVERLIGELIERGLVTP